MTKKTTPSFGIHDNSNRTRRPTDSGFKQSPRGSPVPPTRPYKINLIGHGIGPKNVPTQPVGSHGIEGRGDKTRGFPPSIRPPTIQYPLPGPIEEGTVDDIVSIRP